MQSLLDAVASNDVATAKRLLEQDSSAAWDVVPSGLPPMTPPLVQAAWTGNPRLADLLMERSLNMMDMYDVGFGERSARLCLDVPTAWLIWHLFDSLSGSSKSCRTEAGANAKPDTWSTQQELCACRGQSLALGSSGWEGHHSGEVSCTGRPGWGRYAQL